jgi:RimJ/RimL family protein N-acetyltransferase
LERDTIKLRPATIHDAGMLLEWRNDPETRNASRDTSVVQREDHEVWLRNIFKNSKRRLFVCEENGLPVGTVRADFSDGVYELSWTVAPNARGRGVANQMVGLLACEISDPIRAEVKVGNIASARIAQHAGMTKKAS